MKLTSSEATTAITLFITTLALTATSTEGEINTKDLAFCTTTRHVHLSVGKDASTAMTVSFSSLFCDEIESEARLRKGGNRPLSPSPGAVLLGTDPNNLDRLVFAQDEAKRYNATYKDRLYVSDYQHHVSITGLKPATRYYYKCVTVPFQKATTTSEEESKSKLKKRQLLHDVPKKLPSDVFSFETAPKPGKGNVKLAIIGDVGVRDQSEKCLQILSQRIHDISAIILVGDIAYADGDHRTWDNWFDMTDRLHFLRYKPLQIAAGNHDVESDELTGAIFASYEHRFAMPQLAPAVLDTVSDFITPNYIPYPLPYEYGNSYYSFVLGPTLNIVLNCYSNFSPGSIQYDWLVNELSRDRGLTPWVTVTIHAPLYNTFNLHLTDEQMVLAKKHLEPLFVEHHVNFVLSGHLHAYMRTHPVAYDKLSPTGPIHFILGDGGRAANAPYLNEEPEEWVAVRDHALYGYGTLEFLNETKARYEWVQTGRHTKKDGGQYLFEPVDGIMDEAYFENQYLLSLES